MRKIVAIGGGDVRNKDTLAIDREIINLSGKRNPYLLFIPTASSDHQGYWDIINKYFSTLGCHTDVLYLLKEHPTPATIKTKILSADIIYVGGGNTLKMMKLWRKLGIHKLLKKAWKQGTVLCGISAGSICWFDSGHSDSMSYYNKDKWKYINVKGLGFIKGIHCPHYNSATLGIPRKSEFQKMISKTGGMGVAIDNNCGIEFVGDKFRVIKSTPTANAYLVFKKKGKVISKQIDSKEFAPIKDLY